MPLPPRAAPLAASLFLLPLLWATPAPAESDPIGFDGRVVVAPINLAVSPSDELAPGADRVWRELLTHFVEAGYLVAALERESAEGLWALSLAEARALDPDVGIHDVYARFARSVAEEAEYSTLIFPALVTRAAQVRGEHASWDGVRHFVDVPRLDQSVDTLPRGGLDVFSLGGTGELAAASLHVAVFESSGEMRYEGSGGVALLQEVVRGELRSGHSLATQLREEPFSDPAQLRQGIEAAFRQKSLPAAPAPAD